MLAVASPASVLGLAVADEVPVVRALCSTNPSPQPPSNELFPCQPMPQRSLYNCGYTAGWSMGCCRTACNWLIFRGPESLTSARYKNNVLINMSSVIICSEIKIKLCFPKLTVYFSRSSFRNHNSFYLQIILASISLIFLKNLSLGTLLAFLFTSELPFSVQK